MTVTERGRRRLPGFRFDVQARPLAEALPRMDVAAFVGFAASGPVGMPVAVESAAHFAAVFGDDAPLAWDPRRGEVLRAHLAPAVRAFFRNGGQRCWVVRVARTEARQKGPLNRARPNYFPVPALACAAFDATGRVLSRVAPAYARARSEGSWSDDLRVGASLTSRPVEVRRVVGLGDGPSLVLAPPTPDALAVGDLVRLSFKAEGLVLMFAVESIEAAPHASPPAPDTPEARRAVLVGGRKAVWLDTNFTASPPLQSANARAGVYTHETETAHASNSAAEDSERRRARRLDTRRDADAAGAGFAPDFEERYDAVLQAPSPEEAERGALTFDLLNVALSDAPAPGSVVSLEAGGAEFWLTVESTGVRGGSGGPGKTVRVAGRGARLLRAAPAPASEPSAEVLAFELSVRKGEQYALRLPGLGFERAHASFFGRLPTDEQLYREEASGGAGLPVVWWRPVGDVARFPLAGLGGADALCFPLAMPAVAQDHLGPVRLPGAELERDGLAEFDASLFLDEALTGAYTEDLLEQADLVRYFGDSPRRLAGMHAALGLEEATIIAVPDAAHRGWLSAPHEAAPQAGASPPPARPDWWRFLDCADRDKAPPVREPEWGNFLDCDTKVLPAPELSASDAFNRSGTFTLAWSFTPEGQQHVGPGARFTLEEAALADFADASTLYAGEQDDFTVYGRRAGDYFYRVRVETGGGEAGKTNLSDWSNAAAVRVASPGRWGVVEEGDYDAGVLLAVQRGLLRMCAARGDMFAVMSLPGHYREEAAIGHADALRLTPERTPPAQGVDALGYGEARAHGFGALYHPWLVGREENRVEEVRETPPCGAACGVLAHRALTRGAWVAPANEVLSGVFTLTPPVLAGARSALHDAQVNVIRQEPRGFLSLSADTLSLDPDYRPLNVRRLLQLVRRMALRLGAAYVFEPHGPAFRRLVERGFNAMLDGMFVRGAFAGASPADAYRVVVDDSLNTPRSVEQGRFIVELKVAPSLPMTFLTVRLVQTGERGRVSER